MRSAVAVLVVAAAFPLLLHAKLPSFIKPCSRTDPKLNECALKHGKEALPSVIQGDPKLGIPKLDPLQIPRVVVGDSKTSAGGIGLTFTCEKCTIYGIKGMVPKAVRVDLKKQHLEVEGFVPKVEVKGRYTAKGKILVLPIQGDGQTELVISDLYVIYKVDYDIVKGKDGKNYTRIKNPKIEYKAGGFRIKLTNLFKGDKALGDQMNNFLNENWKDVVNEFGPVVVESINKILTVILNKIGQQVPYDEYLLP